METLLEMQPSGQIAATFPESQLADQEWFFQQSMGILPKDDRRVIVNQNFPSFRVAAGDGGEGAVWTRAVYGVPLASIVDLRAESEAAFNTAYAAARASERVAVAGGFDIHRDGDSLIYAKEDCGEDDALGTFQIVAIPSHPRDAPDYEPLRFDFRRYGAMVGGRCLIRAPLPDYPIHAAETEKWIDFGEGSLWRAVIPFGDSLGEYEKALTAAFGELAAASGGGFDIYADGNRLTYVKRGCAEDDARGRFFLSVFPADRADLPQSARDAGQDHEPLNFDFHSYGAILGADCVIIRELPDYPIGKVETGQWTPGEGELWRAVVGE